MNNNSEYVAIQVNRARASYRVEIADIKKALLNLRVRVDNLLSVESIRTLGEENSGPTGPLTPDQLKKRNERDAGRRERISSINSAAQQKVGEIRKKMGN